MNASIKKIATGTLASAGILGLSLSMSGGTALAQASGKTYQANLTSLNKSNDTGNSTVSITVNGGKMTVRSTGTSANLPHAQHIHIGGTNSCPDISADKDKDGLINTTEGQPAYGPIEVSLTTSGDVSKESGLAVDRFPVADANGNVTYERTVALPQGVTEEMIANGVIVQHGVSELFDDKAKYDGAKKSDIPKSEALPLEATIPSTCGKLSATAVGGVSTGGGSTAGIENAGILSAGIAAVVGAGAILVNRMRSLRG